MKANQILQSDILDILFDERNKLYGAYELRKTYKNRIAVALAGTLTLILTVIIISVIANKMRKEHSVIPMVTSDTHVMKIIKEEPKPITIPKPKPPVHAASVKYRVPIITVDKDVLDPPPDRNKIEKAVIDIKTIAGNTKIGNENPPSEILGTNVIANPANKKEHGDSTFKKVEIEASFPGGPEAWQRYVQKAIMARLDEFGESDYGTCLVQFIVDKNGNVSDVKTTTMQGSKLAEIAVNAIQKGPNWIPAIQNGHYVNAYRTQPVTLTNPDQ